jgi:hypothetical protein
MGPDLFVLVTALDRQGQRSGVLDAGLAGLARGAERFAQTVERLGLARAVAGLAVQGQRLPEVADGLLAAALPELANAQASQGPGLAQALGIGTVLRRSVAAVAALLAAGVLLLLRDA